MQDCDVSQEDVRQAINRFLASLYDKKTEKEQKQLDAALEKKALEEVSVLQNTLADAKAKYSLDTWMKDAAERMAQQLKFGTHISKGVHPDSKGDNVNFKPRHALPDGLVGSQSIHAALLDANGNAAALPLASFFDHPIHAENPQLKIRHLIEQRHPALQYALATDPNQSASYFQAFQAALNSQIDTPASHERNKQLLWPIQDTSHYHTVIPLYPAVLTHQLFQSLNQLRYSESNKQARDNRFKKGVEQRAYLSIRDLATVQLGGTKPQNISQLTSRQSGRNYLLPSLPPQFKQEYLVQLKHSDSSLFNASLAHYCREPLKALFEVVPATTYTLAIRDKRKAAIDEILFLVVLVAEQFQQRPAG
ncbi:MAG: type I-F CRISPR-associated protein Csy1, partial [Pseudomonadota bacterium]|nr:type I-F CRISPR-associated protein Csy1 [Pseudomonadota bacterium]